MENIGDWLYIIIIAIAGISSFISSARKKSQQAEEQRQAQSRKAAENESIPTVQSPPSSSVVQPQPVYRQKTHQPSLKHTKYSFDKHLEGESSIAKYYTEPMTVGIESEDEKYASVTLDDLPADTNEWRKAFVYNEIFNRKY